MSAAAVSPETEKDTPDVRDWTPTVIAVGDLKPNPWNRKKFDETKLKELAVSIEKVGVLQPIVVRKNGSGFEIVAGERRWRAAKIAKLEYVSASVRQLTDPEVVELMAIENNQRENVDPLDESEHYRFLLEKGKDRGYTVELIASKLGKSPSYVYGRLQLGKLIPSVKTALQEGTISVAHATLIAPLQPDDQKQAIEAALPRYGGNEVIPVRRLGDWIKRELHLELKNALFSREDAKLLPKAGPCTLCPKRSGSNPSLFPDLAKTDVCMDRVCFRAKTQAHIAAKRAELSANGQKVVEVSTQRWQRPENPNTLAEDKYTVVEKGDRGAIAAIVVEGEKPGKVMYVRPKKDEPAPRRSKAKAAPKEKAEPGITGEFESREEKDILTALVPAAVEAVKRILGEFKLPDQFAWNIVANDFNLYNWSPIGKRGHWGAPRARREALEELVYAELPGKWGRNSTDPRDGTAARSYIALEVYLARDCANLEKQLDQEIKRRWKESKSGKISPRSFECPNCHAKIGHPCKRPSGHTVFGGGFHAERVKAAALHATVKPKQKAKVKK